jgi:uroporphyrinogen-III synthase
VLLAVSGDATAGVVRRLIGRDPDLNAQGQGATALARRITAVLRRGCVLHPCGDRVRPELRVELSRHGMTVREVTVYVTETAGVAPLDLGAGSVIVFASPSAAEAFLGANEGCLGKVRCVAIGETTARRLRELGFLAVSQADGGHAGDLADAVRRLMRERPRGDAGGMG